MLALVNNRAGRQDPHLKGADSMDTEATTQTQGANIERKVIRANQFILEDDNDKTRAVLDVSKDGVPGLTLLYANGVQIWSKP
jgi:hypothetical protein